MKRVSPALLLLVLAAFSVTAVTVVAEEKPAEDTAKPKLVKDVFPNLTTGTLAHARMAELPEGVLLRSEGLTITVADLNAEINKAPEEMRPELQKNAFFVVEGRAGLELALREAGAWAATAGREPDEDQNTLLRSYIESLTKDIKVSEEEMQEFYERNKQMMGGIEYELIKEHVEAYLVEEKRSSAANAHLQGLAKRTVVEVSGRWTREQQALAMDNPVDKARNSGLPSLVDFGAAGCGPCDMLAPIIKELREELQGKANVVYIDVSEHQILASRYSVQSIPTLVFFDSKGKEVFRHTGFFPKDQIEAKFAEMGVK